MERVRAEGGMLERRRGGVSSSYWNNYWTSPAQPDPPAWHIQQCTVSALMKDGTLLVVARRHGTPSRLRVA